MAAIAIVALLIWVFGSTLSRVFGAALILYSLFELTQNDGSVETYKLLGAGIVAWLAGHWLWAFKHKTWRSQLALNVYRLPLLNFVSPIPAN